MRIRLLPGPDAAAAGRALQALGHILVDGDPELTLALGPLTEDLSGMKSALWALDDPWGFEPDPRVRRIFSADAHAAARYSPPAEVLPRGFDDLFSLPGAKDSEGETWDLCLAGQPHPRRLLVLQALKELMPGLRILEPGSPRGDWPKAKVVLVVQRDAMEGNRRRIPPHGADQELYDAAGLGCCVVTDRSRAGAFEAYADGTEILSYESIRSLPELIIPLLADARRRLALGAAARARTLAEHTLKHRLTHLLERCATGA